MKKTFTANISGTVFHIEEDAYDQLQRYLANIRARFDGSTGSEEIMADIEARIAELFSERLQGRQVVTIEDVDHVKDIMGRPEDFEGAADDGPAQQAPPLFNAPRHRRLFRDPDDHWVGGVIGGISAYFNMDPLWLRIAFIIFIVLGWGSPLVIYLLLWMLVPKAATPAEKLEMRGEPVTVDNIKRVFDEGAERVKQGARRVAGEAEELGRKWRSGAYQQRSQRFMGGAERFFRSFFQVLGRLVGVAVLLLAGLLAFTYVTVAAGSAGVGWFDFDLNNGMSLHALSDAWFVSPEMARWAWIGVGVFCLVPIIGLLLAGLRLVFDVPSPRWLGWVLVPVWFASIALLSVIGIRQANDFRQRERVTDTVDLPMPADRTLHITGSHDPWSGDGLTRHSEDLDLITFDGNAVHWGWAALDVQASSDSLFHLEVVRSAQGANMKDAGRRANGIRFEHTLQDSLLFLAPYYTTDRADKLRGQSVDYIVRVPLGAAVRFERRSARIIHDIDNTTNTWDGDMVGRTWTMTADGLQAGTPSDVQRPAMPTDRKEGTKDRGNDQAAARTIEMPSLIGLLRVGVAI